MIHRLTPIALLFATGAYADTTATAPATAYTLTRAGTAIATGLASADACTAAAKADTEAQKAGAAYACGPALTFTTTYTAPVVMPPVIDHTQMGPVIDPKLMPLPAVGYADKRVRSVYRNTSTGLDCTPGSPNCVIPSSFVLNGPQTIGAFRVSCGFAKMAYDDPIVLPGQPGASHLHTFTGNTGVDAFSTVESIATQGNSTCEGGTLNRSAYWFPALVDTGNGKPLVPKVNVVYYKGSYEFDISKIIQPVPAGLRMVSGNAKNTDPTKTGAQYSCTGSAGTSTWFRTLTGLAAAPQCIAGGEMIMSIVFPLCWDGVNLDSPNHASHMSGAVQDQTSPFAKHCPADHPVALPEISFNVHYAITDATAVSRWRLASDMDPTLPAGISGHGDYFLGWDKDVMQTFVTKCDAAKMDCHDAVLGDGRTLY